MEPEPKVLGQILTAEKLLAISLKRKEAETRGIRYDLQKQSSDGVHEVKLVCPACTKPNTLHITFCTGCSFALTVWDAAPVVVNPFRALVNGEDIGCVVLLRDKDVVVIEDKYPVSGMNCHSHCAIF